MNLFQKIIFHIIATAGIFWALEHYVLIDLFSISGGFWGYITVAIIFGILNGFVKPILKVLTFPIHFLSLGTSSLAINGLLLWITSKIILFLEVENLGFGAENFLVYMVLGLCLAVGNFVLHMVE